MFLKLFFGVALVPKHGALNQFQWIEEVLGFEVLGGPAAPFLQLNSEEIPNVAKHAVANNSDKFAVPIRHGDSRTGGNLLFHLEAYSGKRDVFQICDSPALAPGAVFPCQFH